MEDIQKEEDQLQETEIQSRVPVNDDPWRSAIEAYERKRYEVNDQPLTSKSLTSLLKRLSLTEEELSKAQVHLPALQDVLKQHPLGKAWYLFLSVSWIKALLCVPLCLSRRDIRTPSTDYRPLEETDEEELSPTDKKGSSAAMTRSSYPPLCLTSALLFESQTALRKASAIKAFQETVQVLIDGTWGLLASSLIVNVLVNLMLYPEAYAHQNKLIYLLSLPITIGEYLSNALLNPTVYIPLITIPLTLGIMNALHAAYRIPLKDQDHQTQIQHLIQKLKLHKQGFWQDLGGWLLNTTLPDAFPLLGLCTLVPQVRIQRALARIMFALVWDGRLSSKERGTLFEALRKFSHDSRHLTQLHIIGILAEVLSGITVNRLQILQKAGFDENTLKALLFIKTEAFRELCYLANTYRLPQQKDKVWLSLLPRYLLANYELWRLGYPQYYVLQPIFFLYQGGRLVLSVFLYVSIGSSLYTIFHCFAQGKQWTFISDAEGWVCNVCADLPIFYRNVFTIEDCFSGFAARVRTLKDWKNFISRFDLSGIRELDLSNQGLILSNETDFSILLRNLKPKVKNIKEFYLNSPCFGNIGSACRNVDYFGQIATFIQNSSSLNKLVAQNIRCDSDHQQDGFKAFTMALLSTQIDHLDLSDGGGCDLSALVQVLKNSTVTYLDLTARGSLTNITAIAEVLPYSKLLYLNLEFVPDDDFEGLGCKTFAEVLPKSKLQYLNVPCNSVSDAPIIALAQAIKSLSHDFSLVLDDFLLKDDGIIAFANLLNTTTQQPPLKSLSLILGGSGFVSQEALLILIRSISRSQLVEFKIRTSNHYNYSVIIPELADALNRSKVTKLAWAGEIYGAFDTEAAKILAHSLKTKLLQITELSLHSNAIPEEGMRAIAQALDKTAIQTLDLTGNQMMNAVEEFANVFPKTNITNLYLRETWLNSSHAAILAGSLDQSKIRILDIRENKIGDYGAVALIQGMQGSSVTSANFLNGGCITSEGAKNIAKLLTPELQPGLWINLIDSGRYQTPGTQPSTNLTILRLQASIGDEGVQALCDVLLHSSISYREFIYSIETGGVANSCGVKISPTVLDRCGLISEGHSLYPAEPFLMMARMYDILWNSITTGFNRLVLKVFPCPGYNCISRYTDQKTEDIPCSDIVIANNTFTYSPFYDDLLTLCQTFLQSAGQAAALTTFPVLATEMLHRHWGIDCKKAKAISQGLQVSLLFIYSNSKTALTTGFLAHLLASQLTRSPHIIANVTVGVSITTTILETALTQDVSFMWLALQMGVGFMGAAVGSWGMHQISKVGQWGVQKAQALTANIPQLSFWGQSTVKTTKMQSRVLQLT